MNYRHASGQARVGVVGGGWVATARHIPAFQRDGRATVEALFDRNRSKAESIAKRSRIPRCFDRLEEFLQEPLDIVSVCTPPKAHALLVEAALRASKHVLVEKPMTLTSEEGSSLEALAREVGVVLCPAHNFLFSRSMQRAESLLQKGEAGEVYWAMGVQLSSWRRRLPVWLDDLQGGLFFDEAPHLLYLMRHFLGDLRVEQAWRTSEGKDSPLKTERMEVRLQGVQGAGYLTMWFGAPFSEWLFILFCSRAVLVLDLFRDILIYSPPEQAHNAGDILTSSARGTLQLWRRIGTSGMRYVCGRLFYGHDLLIKRFLDAVINGNEPPVSPRDGWEVVALMEEILRRSSQGE